MERERASNAIPGGGTGPNSAWQFRTDNGYEAGGEGTGTSIFDPVLTELMYSWFCPPGGTVVDPFAGGSVRGIVASRLGRQYVGIELRREQVEANQNQCELCSDPQPVWHCGDSLNAADICSGLEADFVFSCPPYADLEVYSDDPCDLSTMDWPAFCETYHKIIIGACGLLKPDRFAALVVANVRDSDGLYQNLVGETIAAFESGGLKLWNDAILLTAVGSLPVRAGRPFTTSRKLGKTHQNVLVFVKGDARKATEAIGDVQCADIG